MSKSVAVDEDRSKNVGATAGAVAVDVELFRAAELVIVVNNPYRTIILNCGNLLI